MPVKTRLRVALAAVGLFSLGSAQGSIITDQANEPGNDSLAGATAGSVGDEFQGCVGDLVDFACNYDDPHPDNGNDPADFVRFDGLIIADTYTLSLAEIPTSIAVASLVFDLYQNASLSSFASYTLGPSASVSVAGLTGFSSLAVGIRTLAAVETPGNNNIAEGYTVRLEQADGSVPEPATAALLAAGVFGAFAARRRKRK